MSRKIISVLMILVFAVVFLSACGSTTKNETQATQTAPAAEPASSTAAAPEATKESFTIATINKMDGIPWFAASQAGLKEFSAKNPDVKAFIQGPPKVDAALQTQMLEDMIAQKVSAIVVTPYQPEPLEPTLKKAMDQGIAVVSLEASNLQNGYFDIEAFNNEDYGKHLMDALAKGMGEEGEYAVMVASLTSKTHNEWVDSAINYQKEKYPKMKWVGDKIETNDDSQKAYDKMKELLTKFPNLKGIQGSAATDVVGAGQAVEEAGLQDKITVVGTSLPSMVGNLLETGAVDLATCWDPGQSTQVANNVALMVLQGKKDEIKDGADLGVPGYNSIKVVGKVIYGQAWADYTKDTYKNYNY